MEGKSKRWSKALNNPEVVDVLVFGSSVRGNGRPSDIDVCVVWNRNKARVEGAVNKTYDELFDPGFLAREDILADAISLRLGKRLSEAFGFASFAGFIYSLKGRDYNERARLHAAFKKIAGELGVLRFRGFALVPVGNAERFKDFLNYWNIPFRETRLLFPGQEYEFLKGKRMEEVCIPASKERPLLQKRKGGA